jgi:hypothetical protein
MLSIKHIKNNALKWRKAERGTVAIEFALLGPIFLFLILGLIEFGLIAYTNVALESLVTQAGREASIGGSENIELTRSEYVRRLIEEKAGMLIGSENLRIDSQTISVTDDVSDQIQAFDICLDPYGIGVPVCLGAFEDVNGNGRYDGSGLGDDFGASAQVVQIAVTLPWRANFGIVRGIFGDNGLTLLRASTIVKNEPF